MYLVILGVFGFLEPKIVSFKGLCLIFEWLLVCSIVFKDIFGILGPEIVCFKGFG